MPRDGLTFSGYLPPAEVPPDPIDEDWRGPPGPPGAPGAPGPSGGIADLTSPPPIGNTTPNTGAFTALVTAALTATTDATVGGNAATTPLIAINGAATGTRAMRFNSASVNRFAFILDGTDNFLIRPYPNAGSGTNGDTTINRLTGGWTFGTTIGVAGLVTALGYRATGATFNFSTATPVPITRFVSNYTGVYNGTGGTYAHVFETSDTADTTADSGGSMLMSLTHQFSGSKGAKGGLRSFLVQSGASDTGAANPQHISMEAWTQVAFNAGGTNITNAMNGAAYAFNPQVLMLRGATNWFTANPVETNMAVEASTQPITVGGTATAGNTATITFASAGITGSPVAVTYTTGTGQSNSAIANGIVAAINSNAALRAAGIAAQRTTGAAVVNLYWPGELTVTPSVGMSGGSTTTLALGTFLAGASVAVKNMNTFIRLNQDSGTGASLAAFLVLTGQGSAPASGQFGAGLQVGVTDGAWSIAPNGAVIKIAAPQTAAGSQGRSIVFAPQTAEYALDVRYLNVTEATGWTYRSPGLADRGNGVVEIKSAVLTANAAGFAINVTGRVASAVTVAAGGGGGAGSSLGNYAKGDVVFDDYQGQHRVDAVNPATGAVTGITTLVFPHVASGSPPANPLATLGGSGVGLTLTATWPPDAALSLQPSGGKLGFYGATPVVKPTAVPVTIAGVHAALVSLGLIAA
jgi:hypothetical protein